MVSLFVSILQTFEITSKYTVYTLTFVGLSVCGFCGSVAIHKNLDQTGNAYVISLQAAKIKMQNLENWQSAKVNPAKVEGYRVFVTSLSLCWSVVRHLHIVHTLLSCGMCLLSSVCMDPCTMRTECIHMLLGQGWC